MVKTNTVCKNCHFFPLNFYIRMFEAFMLSHCLHLYCVFLSNTCQEHRRHTSLVGGSVSALPCSNPTPRPCVYTSSCGSGTRLAFLLRFAQCFAVSWCIKDANGNLFSFIFSLFTHVLSFLRNVRASFSLSRS